MKRSGQESPKRAKIVLVDDHPIVRRGLAELIEREPGLRICGQADNRAGTLRCVAEQCPDIVLVDISLPDCSGLDLVKDLLAQSPGLRVLVFSVHNEAIYAERALQAGAMGYLMKQEGVEKVVPAIRQILAGEIYLSHAMQAKLLQTLLTHEKKPGLARLSDRELQIFELIGQGLKAREIAERLHLSVKTVESHFAHIKRKLDLRDATGLLQRATLWVAHEGEVAAPTQR